MTWIFLTKAIFLHIYVTHELPRNKFCWTRARHEIYLQYSTILLKHQDFASWNHVDYPSPSDKQTLLTFHLKKKTECPTRERLQKHSDLLRSSIKCMYKPPHDYMCENHKNPCQGPSKCIFLNTTSWWVIRTGTSRISRKILIQTTSLYISGWINQMSITTYSALPCDESLYLP
jgi:hypothetical protein